MRTGQHECDNTVLVLLEYEWHWNKITGYIISWIKALRIRRNKKGMPTLFGFSARVPLCLCILLLYRCKVLFTVFPTQSRTWAKTWVSVVYPKKRAAAQIIVDMEGSVGTRKRKQLWRWLATAFKLLNIFQGPEWNRVPLESMVYAVPSYRNRERLQGSIPHSQRHSLWGEFSHSFHHFSPLTWLSWRGALRYYLRSPSSHCVGFLSALLQVVPRF